MRNLVKNDLGMKFRAVVTKNRINPNQRGHRKERSRGIFIWLKNGAHNATFLIFLAPLSTKIEPPGLFHLVDFAGKGLP